ncbi:MAG: poly(R)-hydroxyalkanoic acid synthase subunit PhaE [Dehalococcoidia bacterium]
MADQRTTPDPFAMFQEWVSNSERQWNSFLNNAMATDEFSQTMGRMMDVYLNMQKNLNEVMGRYLQLINVPTRNDILAIGERLSQIEDRLDQIESGIATAVRAQAAANGAATTSAPRPPRTKKPSKA